MAIRTLIGNDLSNATHFKEGVALANNDTLVLPALAIEVTGGLDCSGFANGIYLYCQDGCAFKLGTYSTFLCKILGMTAKGSGAILKISGAVTKASIEPGAEVTAAGGTWAAAAVSGGLFRANDSAVLTALEVQGGGVVADYNATAISTLIQGGGSVETKRSIKNAKLGGPCTCKMLKAAAFADAGSGILEMNHERAQALIQVDGALTHDYVKCYAGIVNCEGSGGAQTFTNAIRRRKSKISNTYTGSAIVYTNTPDDNGYTIEVGGGPTGS